MDEYVPMVFVAVLRTGDSGAVVLKSIAEEPTLQVRIFLDALDWAMLLDAWASDRQPDDPRWAEEQTIRENRNDWIESIRLISTGSDTFAPVMVQRMNGDLVPQRIHISDAMRTAYLAQKPVLVSRELVESALSNTAAKQAPADPAKLQFWERFINAMDLPRLG